MSPVITTVEPAWALPGARIAILGSHFPLPVEGPPHVLVNSTDARVVAASSRAIRVVVPADVAGGPATVRIDELPGEVGQLDIGRMLAADVHQVDSPAFDRAGRLYVTQSGGRDSKVPIPLFRISREGHREPVPVEIANPTSFALSKLSMSAR